LRRKEKGFEDKQLISNNSNKQLSDANNKLKGDLKKAMDELQELKAEADKNRAENAKAHETQMLIMVMKAKESEYLSQISLLNNRVKYFEEEL
jgi:hypothetical protein